MSLSQTCKWEERSVADNWVFADVCDWSLTLKVAATLVKFAMLPPIIRIFPERRKRKPFQEQSTPRS